MKANIKRAMQENYISKAFRMGLYAAFLVLNGKHGFGQKRLTEFGLEYFRTLDDYLERYGAVAVDAMQEHFKSKGFSDNFSEMDWRKKV